MFQYIDTNKSLSMCSPSCPTLCDPMDCSPARLLCPWNFSRQEYWSGLPFPYPQNLPNSGIEPVSSALAGGFSTTDPPGKPCITLLYS